MFLLSVRTHAEVFQWNVWIENLWKCFKTVFYKVFHINNHHFNSSERVCFSKWSVIYMITSQWFYIFVASECMDSISHVEFSLLSKVAGGFCVYHTCDFLKNFKFCISRHFSVCWCQRTRQVMQLLVPMNKYNQPLFHLRDLHSAFCNQPFEKMGHITMNMTSL